MDTKVPDIFTFPETIKLFFKFETPATLRTSPEYNPLDADTNPDVEVILLTAVTVELVWNPKEDEIIPLEVMFEPACIVPAVNKEVEEDTCPITLTLPVTINSFVV